MPETPQQYKKRIFSYVGNQKPLQILRGTEKRLTRLLQGVPRRRWKRRPAPGKWSIGEIVAHLAEVELVIGYRMRQILSANRTRIQAIDQNAWAATGGYARRDLRASLVMFRSIRRSNLAWLESLPRKKWSCYGLHEERGKETIAQTVRMYAGHDLNHLRQIDSILKQSERR